MKRLTTSLAETADGWNQFWFSPTDRRSVVPVRIAVCSVAAIWMVTFWPNIHVWFGETGLLSVESAGKLVAFDELPAWQSWSPLWWTDSTGVYRAWLAFGLIVACLGAAGIGGRTTMLVLTLWTIAWAHRIAWATGPFEPALVALTAYLAIEPGRPLVKLGNRKNEPERSWKPTVTIRLIQTHWWILVAGGLMSQMYDIVWWRGEALWWLAASGRSVLFSPEDLRDQAMLVNGLTHAFIACEMLALWLVTVGRARWLGVGFGVLVSCAIGLVADQTLYAMLLAASLLAFVTFRRQS